MKRILALDPSGSFEEGKGTTGWSLFKGDSVIPVAAGQIRAEDCKDKFELWKEHESLIETLDPDLIVCEDYRLYKHKAKDQINSRMETPKLIAVIEKLCYECKIPMHFQMASEVKKRWRDELLERKGVVVRSDGGRYYTAGVMVSEHIRDSIRHGVHYITFNKEGK